MDITNLLVAGFLVYILNLWSIFSFLIKIFNIKFIFIDILYRYFIFEQKIYGKIRKRIS